MFTGLQEAFALSANYLTYPAAHPILAQLLKNIVEGFLEQASSVKYFATGDVLEARMTHTINQHWQHKNATKKICVVSSSQNSHVTGR